MATDTFFQVNKMETYVLAHYLSKYAIKPKPQMGGNTFAVLEQLLNNRTHTTTPIAFKN